MNKGFLRLTIGLAGVFGLAAPRAASAQQTNCWLCVAPPGLQSCLPFGPGKKVCTIQSGTCYLSGSPCGFTRMKDLSPDGTVLVGAQERLKVAAPGPWAFLDAGRSVDRNCSGHITSRRYDVPEGIKLRKATASISI